MKDTGQPREPGFYWTLRVGTRFTEHGRPEVVEVKQASNGSLCCDGFGEMEFDEIGFAWQRVKPFDE